MATSHVEDLMEEQLHDHLWTKKVEQMKNGFFENMYSDAVREEEIARDEVNRLIPEANIPGPK